MTSAEELVDKEVDRRVALKMIDHMTRQIAQLQEEEDNIHARRTQLISDREDLRESLLKP